MKKSFKKILIARTDVIGDMVLTLPVFEAVAKKYPEAKIYVLCKQLTRPLLMNNPYIYEILVEEDRKLINNARKLRYYRFDLFIGVWEDPYYAALSFFAGIKYRIGYRVNLFSYLFYSKSKPFPWKNNILHQIDYNLGVLSLIGINVFKSDYPPRLYGYSKIIKNEKIVIAVGSKEKNRYWRPSLFVEVINYLLKNYKLEIELIGGPDELKIGEYFDSKVKSNKLINSISKLSLEQTIKVIASAKYFLGADSGPMHIAAALNVPMVCLFFTKNQKPLRLGPWNTRHILLKAKYQCPDVCRSTFCKKDICATAITPEQVCNELHELFTGHGKINNIDYWLELSLNVLYISDNNFDNQKNILVKPYSLKKLKQTVITNNINVIHVIAKKPRIWWKFIQLWLSNFISVYPKVLFSLNKNTKELYKNEYIN